MSAGKLLIKSLSEVFYGANGLIIEVRTGRSVVRSSFLQLLKCAIGQVNDQKVRNFLHEIRSKLRSGGLLDNDAVQQAYEAGCFCFSQLPLAGFGSVPGSAAPGERHQKKAHRQYGEHPRSYPGGTA